MGNCIAVDIGGTKMLVAEVREDGTIVNKLRFATGAISKEEKVKKLVEGVRCYEREIGWEHRIRPKKMGIGINDNIDPHGGVWIGYDDKEPIALRKRIEKEFDVVCHVDNNVKCTVIAENEFGEGKRCRNMIYLNIGTGLAAGMIVNGLLVRGSDEWAGEVGFMNFTGGKGERVEMLASGMALMAQAKKMISEYPDSILREKLTETVTGWDVIEAADKGDQMAVRILDELVAMNALMISNLTCVLSPEIVILGGGLISGEGHLAERIVENVTEKAKSHLERGIKISGLDPAYAGLMGAAAIGLGFQGKYDNENMNEKEKKSW